MRLQFTGFMVGKRVENTTQMKESKEVYRKRCLELEHEIFTHGCLLYMWPWYKTEHLCRT